MCQEDQNERSDKLIDPANSKSSAGSGYVTFHNIDSLPMIIDEELLNASNDLENKLRENCVKYYKNVRINSVQ